MCFVEASNPDHVLQSLADAAHLSIAISGLEHPAVVLDHLTTKLQDGSITARRFKCFNFMSFFSSRDM